MAQENSATGQSDSGEMTTYSSTQSCLSEDESFVREAPLVQHVAEAAVLNEESNKQRRLAWCM